MIKKILIANRGEIACRIHRTCERMGIATATVHDPADRAALHVRTIGESIVSKQGYLDIEAIVEAAKKTQADAIHPGIGFLSENPDFVKAVEQAGMIFIGPNAETMSRFADKASAKAEVRKLNIPIIKGSEQGSSDAAVIEVWVAELVKDLADKDNLTGVMLKATAGGGGRGIRVLDLAGDLPLQIESAMREAKNAFGVPDLLVEQYVPAARHIEVQLLGDGKGNALHFFERECSLQRRHQKVIEESPAIALNPALRDKLTSAAIEIAKACEYRSLGTVEFLVKDDAFFFLELNPRLQVEHPVTEAVTGFDLVELQLRTADAEALSVEQQNIKISGHALEARVYAENVSDGFTPSCGIVDQIDIASDLAHAGGVRVDYGVSAGDEISPFFDPMIAKVICHEKDREQALIVLDTAIRSAVVQGVDTNLAFLSKLLNEPRVIDGDIDNSFIDKELERLTLAEEVDTRFYAIAGIIRLLSDRGNNDSHQIDPWSRERFTNWRMGGNRLDNASLVTTFTTKGPYVISIGGVEKTLRFSSMDNAGEFQVLVDEELHSLTVTSTNSTGANLTTTSETSAINRSMRQLDAQRNESGERPTLSASCLVGFSDELTLRTNYGVSDNKIELQTSIGSVTANLISSLEKKLQNSSNKGTVTAPVMGQVVKVNVSVGDKVKNGDLIAVQESMKMELSMLAPCDGVIVSLNCQEGDMIERHSFVAEVKGE
ncbi:MAG: hypothetical protein KUG82_23175 [Pseudomonadales bacterium]|nr:hypothetical protein [Pseudomonadales bacterium]